jgi:DNA-binding beta-propeller fold protein YncE
MPARRLLVVALACMLVVPCGFSASRGKEARPSLVPRLELDGGRQLVYEGTFGAEADVRPKKGFWTRMVDVIAGEATQHNLLSPYSVVTDSHGRIIVSDPGMSGIHIFDFEQHKYKFISRQKEKDGLIYPQCIAVDAADNIYATDSDTGKIFVFDANGKFQRVIGSLKGGEGFFKRPTGIAVDSANHRIYVSDTLRNQIFVLDMNGNVLQTIGKGGSGKGEFNFPTELRLHGDDLIVVDAMNFRIQVLDRAGGFKYAIGQVGEGLGEMFRPKGVSVDSEGHFYVVDGLRSMVQVFDDRGQLLYYFGQKGTGFGDFQLPTGLFIDGKDRVFVVDSYNRRVQVFQYYGLNHGATQ